MEAYGLIGRGKIIVEKLDTKPSFATCDCGRLIYVTDEEAFYGGSNDRWVYIAGKKGTISKDDLMWGTGPNDIHAGTMPFDIIDTNFDASKVSTVEDALNALSDGSGIGNNAISSDHLQTNSVIPDAINFGFGGTHVSAQSIPCRMKIASNIQSNSNIQETIEKFQSEFVYRSEYSVETSDWIYDSTEDLYSYTILFDSYINIPPVVQCLYNNELILPAKVKFYSGLYKVTIYMAKTCKLYVIILG